MNEKPENEEITEETRETNESEGIEEVEEVAEDGELKKKDKDYDELYDRYLRVRAEYENFRKRTAKEKEGIYSDAIIDVLNNILPVADNMERALQFSDAEKVLEGIKLIYAQFAESLARMGVGEIKSDGEPFDPAIHNAVAHGEDGTKPENTVAETLQKGYIKGDKVIRPAMVRVVN